MSVHFASTGVTNFLERGTGIVQGDSDYSTTFWARVVTAPAGSSYVALWETNGPGAYYIGIYTHPAEADRFYLEVSDGMVYEDGTPFPFEANTYLPFAYVREGNEHRFFCKTGLIGTATLDITAAVFDSAHLGSGDSTVFQDTFDQREWVAALTEAEVIGWLEEILPVDAMQASLEANIALQINPVEVTLPLPWLPQPPEPTPPTL